jgi:hypothetical protein
MAGAGRSQASIESVGFARRDPRLADKPAGGNHRANVANVELA